MILVLEATEVMAQILELANNRQLKKGLAATFSPGTVTLTQVGSKSFSEWSCYGEPIHVAQRLQGTKPDTDHSSEECNSWFALGTPNTGDETGEFWRGELEALASALGSVRRLDLSDWTVREERFKGVGNIAYLAGYPKLQPLDE